MKRERRDQGRRAGRFARLVAPALAGGLLALGCGRPPAVSGTAGGPEGQAPVETRWVMVYDPARAWNGYTLTLHKARTPVLLDMNGRPVHAWPAARIKSRVRLLPDGSLLGLGLGRQVVEYDWEGRQTWQFRTPGAIPHHDVIRLANGNTLVLVLPDGAAADTLLEVDRAGRVVWTWRSAEHLGALIPPHPAHPNDLTHFNSLQELPENPWHAAGDRRFRPGNLLVSSRNLSAVFIVERPSGAVVWSFTQGLDLQHEALMKGAGLIQIFNNRSRSFSGDRQSEILEIDPRDGAVAWRYKTPGFFTHTAGVEQPLPNGNELITSTRGGRVFEVTRAGDVVWEWVPPYEPVRAVRVSPGFCPQLAGLPRAAAAAVVPPPGYRYVDPDSYRFARQGSRTKAVIEGEKRTVLAEEDDCRDLLLPAGAKLKAGYGIDRERLRAAGRAERPPVFALTLRPAGGAGGAEVDLVRDTVGLAGPAWRQRTLPLDRWAHQAVRLCVSVDGLGGGGAAPATRKKDRFAWWEQPLIATARDLARAGEGDDGDDDAKAAPRDLTPEELEVRRKHLKALGYIN